jgi:hypothetical protein
MPIECGRDEDGDPVSTCIIQWDVHRPPAQQQPPPKKKKTDAVLELAIKEVGLPADVEVLRKAFYKLHGGNKSAANMAWNRAIRETYLGVDAEGRLDWFE